MIANNKFAWTPFGMIGSVIAIAAIGVLAANAQQRGVRPYIPRAGEVRPISRPQPPAIPQPAASKTSGGEAQPAVKQPVPKQDGDAQKQGIIDMEDTTWDQKTDVTTGRDLTYKEDDMVVTGAKARYKRFTKKTGLLDAEGNLVMDDSKYHITGEKGSYDSRPNAKLAIITGSVVIVIKPKDKSADPNASDVESEKGRGGTIYCDRVEYYRAKKYTILTGHLVFKQKIKKDNGQTVERTLTAEHAEHDKNVEKLHLFAPVDMKDTDDQEGHFDKDVFIGTKEGEETLQSSGRFKGTFNVESDDEDKGGGSAADKKSDTTKKPDGKDSSDGKKDTPGAAPDNKQDTPRGTQDKKPDTPGSTPEKKQDPPVKKT